MPMLTGTLELHDIRDTEAFCARLIPATWRQQLEPHDQEDLLAYLVETAWELSTRYDHGDPQYPPRFSVYAHTILQRRTHDWLRLRNGRTVWRFKTHTYERARPTLISSDTEVGQALADRHVDGPEHRPTDLAWLHRTRNSKTPPPHPARRPAPANRAA